MQVICKHYAILYKGLEHLRILESVEGLEPMPRGYQGMTVFTLNGDFTSSGNFLCSSPRLHPWGT